MKPSKCKCKCCLLAYLPLIQYAIDIDDFATTDKLQAPSIYGICSLGEHIMARIHHLPKSHLEIYLFSWMLARQKNGAGEKKQQKKRDRSALNSTATPMKRIYLRSLTYDELNSAHCITFTWNNETFQLRTELEMVFNGAFVHIRIHCVYISIVASSSRSILIQYVEKCT